MAAIRDSRAASDLLYLAGAAFTRGRVEDARRLSSLVIEADPSIPDAYYLLGQINVLYGGTPDAAQAAVDIFSKGVALRPADMMMRAGWPMLWCRPAGMRRHRAVTYRAGGNAR